MTKKSGIPAIPTHVAVRISETNISADGKREEREVVHIFPVVGWDDANPVILRTDGVEEAMAEGSWEAVEGPTDEEVELTPAAFVPDAKPIRD